MKNKRYILSFMAVGALLLAGCSAENLPDNGEGGSQTVGKDGTVTFSVGLENFGRQLTRVTNDGDNEISHIGKGENIDKLIYAVYMVDEATGNYALDTPAHPVQTVMPADFSDGKRVEFTLDNLQPDRTYCIAFWAQNSECDAYDTSDLTCVEVKYKDATGNNYVNNDETRDAFCSVWKGSFNSESSYVDVTLKRPLSQINVGTTGADYNNILQGQYVFPNVAVTHSKITVKGVARYMNVVDDRILLEDDMAAIGKDAAEALTEVTYDWAELPAYMYMDGIPADNNSLLQSPDEEFLRVELNGDDSILGYLTSYPTIKKDSDGNITEYLTETFKYLSMCYVLAPATTSGQSVFERITVGFAEDAEGKHGANTVNVASAKCGRNWRTNILGGLLFATIDAPTEPDEPDDPVDPTPDDPVDPTPDDPVDPTPDYPDPPVVPNPPSILTATMDFDFLIITDYFGGFNVDKDGNELK